MTNVLHARGGGQWEGRGGKRERDEWNNNMDETEPEKGMGKEGNVKKGNKQQWYWYKANVMSGLSGYIKTLRTCTY